MRLRVRHRMPRPARNRLLSRDHPRCTAMLLNLPDLKRRTAAVRGSAQIAEHLLYPARLTVANVVRNFRPALLILQEPPTAVANPGRAVCRLTRPIRFRARRQPRERRPALPVLDRRL